MVVTMTPRNVGSEQATEFVTGVGSLERWHACRGELAGDLFDQVKAIEHDQDGWCVELKLAPQLGRCEGDQQSLAGTLVVPDEAAVATRLEHPGDNRVDRFNLGIARNDLAEVDAS